MSERGVIFIEKRGDMKNISLKERYELKKIRENRLISEVADTEDKRRKIAKAAKKIEELSKIEGLKGVLEPLKTELLVLAGDEQNKTRDFFSRFIPLLSSNRSEINDFLKKIEKFEEGIRGVARTTLDLLKPYLNESENDEKTAEEVFLGRKASDNISSSESTPSISASTPETEPAAGGGEAAPSSTSPDGTSADPASTESGSETPAGGSESGAEPAAPESADNEKPVFNKQMFSEKDQERKNKLIEETENVLNGNYDGLYVRDVLVAFSIKLDDSEAPKKKLASSIKKYGNDWDQEFQKMKDALPKELALASDFQQKFKDIRIADKRELSDLVQDIRTNSSLEQLKGLSGKSAQLLMAMLGISDINDIEKFDIENIREFAKENVYDKGDDLLKNSADSESEASPGETSETGEGSEETGEKKQNEDQKSKLKEAIKVDINGKNPLIIKQFRDFFKSKDTATWGEFENVSKDIINPILDEIEKEVFNNWAIGKDLERLRRDLERVTDVVNNNEEDAYLYKSIAVSSKNFKNFVEELIKEKEGAGT